MSRRAVAWAYRHIDKFARMFATAWATYFFFAFIEHDHEPISFLLLSLMALVFNLLWLRKMSDERRARRKMAEVVVAHQRLQHRAAPRQRVARAVVGRHLHPADAEAELAQYDAPTERLPWFAGPAEDRLTHAVDGSTEDRLKMSFMRHWNTDTGEIPVL
jgi:hypothetical protein